MASALARLKEVEATHVRLQEANLSLESKHISENESREDKVNGYSECNAKPSM